jgi:indolepyruvate ferredoxin oxidoreductase, alpha subunit
MMSSGIEAACKAISDSGVKLIVGVPGYPINGLFSALQRDTGLRAEWQYNEKIAYEMAMGAAACGDRSIVIAKHVGLNVMSDPLIISATHGIGAGIVVIAGDDVGAIQSQNEQDSRWYGKLAEIPVLDPSTPGDLYDAIFYGLDLSERISAPVIVRVTEPVLSASGEVLPKIAVPSNKKLDRSVWSYTMYGKHQKYLSQGWEIASKEAAMSSLNRCTRRSPIGIISSGHASRISDAVASKCNLSHLSLGFVNPMPKALVCDFLSAMDFVLVCEEVAPFIEEQLCSPNVKGRLTGHLPRTGPLDEASIRHGVENIAFESVPIAVEPETMKSRGMSIGHCDNCPYGPVYRAIRSLGVPVAGDMGCSILAASPPLSMIDVACSLGSSVSSACGFNRKGIAMLGDFGLLHTGLQSMLNAKLHDYDVLVVVFANGQAAMTGGQGLPDVTGILKDIFKDDCIVVEASDIKEDKVRSDLDGLLQCKGMKVYVIRSQCPVGAHYRMNDV